MLTVQDFIQKTPDSYVDLAICEYNGEKLQRRIALEKHKWFCADIPEDLLKKEIGMIIPYYGQITVEVEKYDYEKEQKIWFDFYLRFNDDNERHAEQSFAANGYHDVSAEELHSVNLGWFSEIMAHGHTYDEIIKIMPSAKEYGDELKNK